MKVQANGALPQFVPNRRDFLLDALASMEEPPLPEAVIKSRLWGHVDIDADACNSCGACATFCPTGALSVFDPGDGNFGLRHLPGDCMRCNCCRDVCRKGAIRITDAVTVRDITENHAEEHVLPPTITKSRTPGSVLERMKDWR